MRVTLYFDGAAMPNPGVRGIGVVIEDSSGIVKEISERLDGIGTSNSAEYTALIRGLEEARKLGADEIMVRGDSQLVIRQLEGKYRVTHANIKPLYEQVAKLAREFDRFELQWIPRENNKKADELSTRQLASVSQLDPTGTQPMKKKAELGSSPSRREHDVLCPKCRKPCTLTIQRASNGEERVRQACPEHGFVTWAPAIEPFLTIARRNTK